MLRPTPPVLIDQSLRKKKELIMPISARAHDKLKQQYTSCEYLFVAKHIFSSLLRGEGEEGGGGWEGAPPISSEGRGLTLKITKMYTILSNS